MSLFSSAGLCDPTPASPAPCTEKRQGHRKRVKYCVLLHWTCRPQRIQAKQKCELQRQSEKEKELSDQERDDNVKSKHVSRYLRFLHFVVSTARLNKCLFWTLICMRNACFLLIEVFHVTGSTHHYAVQ